MAELPTTLKQFQQFGQGYLPGHLGIAVQRVQPGEVEMELEVQPFLLAPNGFLHAGSVVSLADSAAGYGCMASLPEGATGFTTVELKSNHLGTAREGQLRCVARAVHRGRTTQVWDAEVRVKGSDKTIALFRCTQLILYPST